MSKKSLDLTLLIPGFMRPELSLSCEMPALSRMLSRADSRHNQMDGFEALLFDLFGLDNNKGDDLPVAPITYALDSGEAPAGYLLRADPVYCQADRDKVLMLGHDLGLSREEADQMVADLNRLFAEDGWEFIAPQPDRWYLKMPGAEKISTTPLSKVMGQNIHHSLPQAPDNMVFQRAMSEIEMLLHSNFANQQRQSNRQLPVTNLWLWGGGVMPAKPTTDWVQVWSSDVLALGLAKLAGVPRRDLPEDASQWLEQAVTTGHHLVTLPFADDAWQLNQQWFEPLSKAIKLGQLNSLTLWLDSDRIYTINARSQRRWWRRDKGMKSFL